MVQLRALLLPVLASALVSSAALAAPQYGGRNTAPPARAKEPPKNDKPAPPGPTEAPAPNEARYWEKLDKADRDALQANVGYLMPAPCGQLEWVGGDALMPADFRNKVTVIQVVSSKQGGRAVLDKLIKQVPAEVRVLGLHTPENSEKASQVFSTNPACTVAVDTSGHWCDALGVWKKPVNIVIDKTGAVRFVGLTDMGLKAKIPELLEEQVDESVVARPRPAATPAQDAAAEKDKPTSWPTFNNQVQSAADMRGAKIPGFQVQKWVTSQPDPSGRLVAIDFWATWCGPCKAAIPHINELNSRFGGDVLFVGLSDETSDRFEKGLEKANLRQGSFTYALALDPQARLKKGFFKISGIPHMAIMSPDGVVRWQGHPDALQEDDVAKLVAANKALGKLPAKAGARGWVNKAATSPTKN